jgi:hypothetical protein
MPRLGIKGTNGLSWFAQGRPLPLTPRRAPCGRAGEITDMIAAFEIADWLLDCGLAGVTLSKSLQERFPTATRGDMCLGVAIFATDMHALLLLAEASVRQARSGAIAV